MLKWNLTRAMSTISTVLSQQEQDSLMNALTTAGEEELKLEEAFRAHSHKTKFVRSNPESEKMGHNFRMARTFRDTIENGNKTLNYEKFNISLSVSNNLAATRNYVEN